MTCVKFFGITRARDVETINALHRRYPKTPLYVGFVFYAPSKRAISASQALQLKGLLAPEIPTVGVFVNEQPAAVASLLNSGVIDYAQLHGSEDEAYITQLRERTKKLIIQAFCVKQASDIERARTSSASMVLLDAGKGEGARFNWSLLGDTRAVARADAQEAAHANRHNTTPESLYANTATSNTGANAATTSNDAAHSNSPLQRAYLLAGGLSPENVFLACELCHPFGVDVSSGIETQDSKDPAKMQRFLEEVVRFDTWYAAPTQAPPSAQSAPTQARPSAQTALPAHNAANASTSTHSPCSQRRHHD